MQQKLINELMASEQKTLRLNKRQSSSSTRISHENVEYCLLANVMSILIIYKIYDDECVDIANEMIQTINSLKVVAYLEKNSYERVLEKYPNTHAELLLEEDQEKIAFLIVIGGDGTILYALKQFQKLKPPPVLAFSKGTLGFMCLFDVKDSQELIAKQILNFKLSQQFVVEKKLRLFGCLSEQDKYLMQYHVLNEFVISRGSNPACLYLEIYINDVLLTVASGDGVIVATPTGSTAYFLSAGGPIVQNEVSSISIAPICPLSLSFRPIVLPDCLRIRIKLAPESRQSGFICCDGQDSIEFKKDMVFEIQKSPYEAQVIQQQADDDYSIWVKNLRKKLSWNKVFTEKKNK